MKQEIRSLMGWFTALFYRLNSKTKAKIELIIETILEKAETAPREKIFVMMVGFSLSGKTWVMNHHPLLPRFFQIKTRDIHDLLNDSFPLLDDDKSTEGPGYWTRKCLTGTIRDQILKKVCQKGRAIVSDSGNQVAKERRSRLRIVKKMGYKTVIVWVICDEVTLTKRLKDADLALEEQGKPPTWVDLYRNIQQDRFEPPVLGEADDLIIFQSGWDDITVVTL